jgi:hypothetical protein
MRRFVDLHTHSTASDGTSTPSELILLAERKRLAAVALTDHDTTAGLSEARAAGGGFPHLRLVAGMEVSAAWPAGVMHVLALGVDERAPALRQLAECLLAARNQRNPKIIARLQALGLAIDMDDVRAELSLGQPDRKHEVVGRLHIAWALLAKRYARDVADAFDRYIGQGAAAFVDKEKLSPRQVVSAIKRAGALAVLAHPPQLNYRSRAELERIIRDLLAEGLDGLEVYHTDHDPCQTRLYLELARKFHLGVTGGSDFHGHATPKARLGRPLVPLSAMGEEFLGRLFSDSTG